MKSGVYCIQNKINGKVYIGSTVNLNKFCKENNLDKSNIYQVLVGNHKSCKGYTSYKK